MSRARIALVGAGAMATNHARVIAESERAVLAYVADPAADRAAQLAGRYDAKAVGSSGDALDCDAAVIACATAAHVESAVPFLEAGLPVLVEKPAASDLDGVKLLLKLAEDRGVPLACGFVERFNAAVRTARSLVSDQPLHIVGQRHSPPTDRMLSSAVTDLLVHDIDLALELSGTRPPRHVAASGLRMDPAGFIEAADCTLLFEDGPLVSLSASRLGQRKIRSLSIASRGSLVEVDLLRQNVTVYRHVTQEIVQDDGPVYRAATEIDIPFVRHSGEPLALQLEHFLELVGGGGDPALEARRLLLTHEVTAAVEEASSARSASAPS